MLGSGESRRSRGGELRNDSESLFSGGAKRPSQYERILVTTSGKPGAPLPSLLAAATLEPSAVAGGMFSSLTVVASTDARHCEAGQVHCKGSHTSSNARQESTSAAGTVVALTGGAGEVGAEA